MISGYVSINLLSPDKHVSKLFVRTTLTRAMQSVAYPLAYKFDL